MNGIMMQTFQWDLPADGTLWQTLAKKARTLSLLGVTAAWLPPAYSMTWASLTKRGRCAPSTEPRPNTSRPCAA